MFDQSKKDENNQIPLQDIKDNLQKLLNAVSAYKTNFVAQLEMQKMVFSALIETLSESKVIDMNVLNSKIAFLNQIYAIEKEIGSDADLNLEPKEIIDSRLDVMKLAIDVLVDGVEVVKDLKGSIYLLGNEKLPKQVEENLIGKKVGDQVSVDVQYGEDASVVEFKGKKVTFNVTIISVKRIKNLG